MVSERARSIDSSGIRRVFDLAAKMVDPINLSIGQPFFDAPDAVKQGAIDAIQSGRNGYTVTQGIAPLRKAIADRYGFDPDSGEITCCVTSGTSGGLMLAYMALLDPGDEVLIPDPFFCMYRDVAALINAVPTYYDTYPDFSVRPQSWSSLVTPRTRAIVVSNPGNPTGKALTRAEVTAVVEFAREHKLWLLYDEIYSTFAFDQPHVDIFGEYEKAVILNGFSKGLGVPGWRVGYAIGPTALLQQMLKIQQYTFVCAPSVAQWGIVAGMNSDLSVQLQQYRENRDYLCDALQDCYSFVRPGGAFYLYPEAPGGSGQQFVERCIESNLLVVPGNVFSRQDSHFRVSFSAPRAQLERGVEVLRRLAHG